VRAPRRISVAKLRDWGLEVELDVERGGRAIAALRSAELGRVPGKRGSTDRPRSVTVARTRDGVGPGPNTLFLVAGPRAAARLRRRRSTLTRLTVQVREADGRVHVLTRKVRVVRGNTQRG
jgi:hypothetical protein